MFWGTGQARGDGHPHATRGLVYRAACGAIDGKYPQYVDTSRAKLFATEVLTKVVNMAIFLHGGDGLTTDFPIQRLWRDARMAPTGGGSSYILKNLIAGRLLNRKFDQHK
ncbi:MAG: acyl-CoA/acyl-ACP dehydrogenase [Chloroflexi bacterium]|nr:acyl-CoA/acyl-ACP dehydrogenase [Chloroflexota bacterium]